MSEFVQPRAVEIDPIMLLSELFNTPLRKDLNDNEEICPVCHGLGLIIRNNVYGLSNDPNRMVMFPYKHQSVSFCDNCYNGVIRRCKYCGENKTRGYHNCDGTRQEFQEEQDKKEIHTMELARKIQYDSDEAKNMKMLFSESYPYNEGYFSDWDDYFNAWYDSNDHSSDNIRPEYVYGTYEMGLKIDIENAIEDACSDLHESARDNISGIDKLQEIVDDWCSEQSGCVTYFQDQKVAVKIPWEECDQ